MKIFSVCSARPNFVKLASVHHAFEAKGFKDHKIVHTGQHHDPLFSDVFFKELDIPLPAFNLGIHGGTNEEQQGRVEEASEKLFSEEEPDMVLVYGDVNGAVAAARAAASLKIPVAHVEAGLRSFDDTMQEEHNRIAIDTLAKLLFATERSGVSNLKKEKVGGKIHLVGNTMIDTLIRMLPSIQAQELPETLPDDYAVVTLHRPVNVDDPEQLARVVDFLNELSGKIPVIFPVHLRTQDRLRGIDVTMSDAIMCIDPLPYMTFMRLVLDARFVLTDSGGIQEETTYLRKRCFTLRPSTERPITTEIGSNRLVRLDSDKDRAAILEAADDDEPFGEIPPLWDGHAGDRIVDILLK